MKKLKDNSVFIRFYIIGLVIHMILPLNWADDKIFFEKVTQTTFSQFINGSARPITDSLTYIFASFPMLWRFLNPFMLTLFAKLLSELIPTENIEKSRLNKYLCAAVIFPALITVDAGFIATTVNYLWPFTFGLICLLPLKKIIQNRKINFSDYVYSIPAMLCAVNMQQTAACLTAVFLLANIIFAIKRKFAFYTLLQLILSGAGSVIMLIINTVGDNNRMARESAKYFPDFIELNIFEKTELGFSSTFYCMTMETRFAFLAFSLFTFFVSLKMFKSKNNTIYKFISALPFLFTVVFGIMSLTQIKETKFWAFITGGMKHYRMNKAIYSFELIPDLLFICIAVCIVISLYKLLDKKNFVTGFLILTLGFASRVIMGFSPTVWASGYRTFFILFTAFIVVGTLIADSKKPLMPQKHQRF